MLCPFAINIVCHLQNKFWSLLHFKAFCCLDALNVFVDTGDVQPIACGRSNCFPNSRQSLTFDTFTVEAIEKMKEDGKYL